MSPHRICLAALCLGFTLSGSGAAQSSESLYARSLAACVENKQGRAGPLSVVSVLDNAVTQDPALLFPRPSHVGSVRLEFLDYESLKRRFRQTGREFPVIEIKPMRDSRDVLLVDCADYRVTVRKRRVVLGVAGGTSIHWRFDARAGDYEKIKVEPWAPQM